MVTSYWQPGTDTSFPDWMEAEDVFAIMRTIRYLKSEFNAGQCESKDYEDFPEDAKPGLSPIGVGRCSCCQAGEVVEWLEGLIS